MEQIAIRLCHTERERESTMGYDQVCDFVCVWDLGVRNLVIDLWEFGICLFLIDCERDEKYRWGVGDALLKRMIKWITSVIFV